MKKRQISKAEFLDELPLGNAQLLWQRLQPLFPEEVDPEDIEQGIYQLPDARLKVLTMLYGLHGGEPYTQDEVAVKAGLSRTRIQQLQREAEQILLDNVRQIRQRRGKLSFERNSLEVIFRSLPFREGIIRPLQDVGITRLPQLLRMTADELVAIPGLGPTKVQVIKQHLIQLDPAVYPWRELMESPSTDVDEIWALVYRLGLGERITHFLHQANINTLKDLTNISRAELLHISSIGPGSADAIERLLAERGLQLRQGGPKSTST